MFSDSYSIYQDTVENSDELANPDDVLMLEDNFASEIVTKRFHEGGRLTFKSPTLDTQSGGTSN